MPEVVPLPPVREVAAGTWSIPVALPGNPLHYVIVHALETDDGIVLIDAGWDSDDSWDALIEGLGALCASVADVTGVLVTHIHPDHYGLAPRVRRASGAWVSLHPADLTMILRSDAEVDGWLAETGRWLRRAGAPLDALAVLGGDLEEVRRILLTEPPDLLVEHGDVPPVKGRSLVAVHTPGHTDGHLCFHEPARGLLYAGDHVLPRISPNVSSMSSSLDDPLGAFIGSLLSVRDLPCDLVLPAHVGVFAGLAGRVDELLEHHDERLRDIAASVRGGAETVWEIAAEHPWKRGWAGLTPAMRRAALGETEAHLLRLQAQGVVCSAPAYGDDPVRWTVKPD
ncbi:MBL fold metallo-hydrolase [soil metagenome]